MRFVLPDNLENVNEVSLASILGLGVFFDGVLKRRTDTTLD